MENRDTKNYKTIEVEPGDNSCLLFLKPNSENNPEEEGILFGKITELFEANGISKATFELDDIPAGRLTTDCIGELHDIMHEWEKYWNQGDS